MTRIDFGRRGVSARAPDAMAPDWTASVAMLTWAVWGVCPTLAATLQSVTDPLQRAAVSWLRLREDLTLSGWRTARESIGENLVLPDVDHRAVRGLKFSAALPERLAVATVASRLADFDSARSVLGKRVRFQYDS